MPKSHLYGYAIASKPLVENNENKTILSPPPHRALVFQGGGALGAYEAGVFEALCKILTKQDEEDGRQNKRPLFDIVAGTSIGAINGALLVSYVKKNKTWKGSAQRLKDFWNHLASATPPLAKLYETGLGGEATRRYYSTKYFLYRGVENVFSSPTTLLDYRFFDYYPFFDSLPNVTPNTWFRYDNTQLKNSLEHEVNGDKFVNFPIKTDFYDDKEKEETKEPRLVVVSVDVQEGAAVTFDSYKKKGDKTRKTEYSKVYDEILDKDIDGYVIEHEGITAEHLMASASVPVHYDYTKIETKKLDSKNNDETITQYFWDGGILSNTPLRELISEHKKYWEKRTGLSDKSDEDILNDIIDDGKGESPPKIPDLEVYIIDVWPTKENHIPMDRDGEIDRLGDIRYHDKTRYDEKIAKLVTDYIDLAEKLIKLVKDDDASKDKLKEILQEEGSSKFRTAKPRKHTDLLKGRFHIDVKRIERRYDENTVSNKWVDFTQETIDDLIKQGCKDAMDFFAKQQNEVDCDDLHRH